MVYLALVPETGMYKIGCSLNPTRRVENLTTTTRRKHELIKVIRGTYDEERRLHELFKKHRAFGEYFHPNTKMLAHFRKQKGIKEWEYKDYQPRD